MSDITLRLTSALATPTRYGFTTDGRTFYFTMGAHESDIWVLELEES